MTWRLSPDGSGDGVGEEIAVLESVRMPTSYGEAEVIVFSGLPDGKDHLALGFGSWRAADIVDVRIHSECVLGDVFGSKRCDGRPQLDEALALFTRTAGLIIYLRQEGRGIGLLNQVRSYRLQDAGMDTYEANRALGFPADGRDFRVVVGMLKALGITRVRLLSNNPLKALALREAGVQVAQRKFTGTHVCRENQRYLTTKLREGGHDGLDSFKLGVT